jgi:hypothetical protein
MEPIGNLMMNNLETFEEVDGNILGIGGILKELDTYILGNPLGNWEQQNLILCTRSQIYCNFI